MTVANPSPLIAVDSFVGESLTPNEVLALRGDFPIFKTCVNGKPLVYLDNGATTQKPQAMIDRINLLYSKMEESSQSLSQLQMNHWHFFAYHGNDSGFLNRCYFF